MSPTHVTDRQQPVSLDDGDELRELLAAHETVLVQYYTNGCGICQSMEPVLGTVAKASDAVVALINPRDDPELIEAFSIRRAPTLLLFHDGELVGRRDEGFYGVEAVLEFIDTATTATDGGDQPSTTAPANEEESTDVRVWLVERTYSDDEQNLIILTYATTDGTRYYRRERALTSFTDNRETTAAVTVDPQNLGAVTDPDERERYASEASRMAAEHDPEDTI